MEKTYLIAGMLVDARFQQTAEVSAAEGSTSLSFKVQTLAVDVLIWPPDTDGVSQYANAVSSLQRTLMQLRVSDSDRHCPGIHAGKLLDFNSHSAVNFAFMSLCFELWKTKFSLSALMPLAAISSGWNSKGVGV